MFESSSSSSSNWIIMSCHIVSTTQGHIRPVKTQVISKYTFLNSSLQNQSLNVTTIKDIYNDL